MSDIDRVEVAQAHIRAAIQNVAEAMGQVAMAGIPIDAYRVETVIQQLQNWSRDIAAPDIDQDELVGESLS